MNQPNTIMSSSTCWRFSLSGNALVSINVVTLRRPTLCPVSAWMGDRLRASKLSRCVYITSHPGQTQPGHPSVGRRCEYQLRLGR